ncbi:MAG: hypothetical protein IJR86_08180 [Bacteroidaceae bacterium]|nr:hypothetical protein [Bacteroidaceae bacterium]
MSRIFDTYHTVKEWEDAAAKDGRITFNAVYYVMGKRVLDHVTGIVRIEQQSGKPAHRCVMWHRDGQCYVGKERLPEYDIIFDD